MKKGLELKILVVPPFSIQLVEGRGLPEQEADAKHCHHSRQKFKAESEEWEAPTPTKRLRSHTRKVDRLPLHNFCFDLYALCICVETRNELILRCNSLIVLPLVKLSFCIFVVCSMFGGPIPCLICLLNSHLFILCIGCYTYLMVYD